MLTRCECEPVVVVFFVSSWAYLHLFTRKHAKIQVLRPPRSAGLRPVGLLVSTTTQFIHQLHEWEQIEDKRHISERVNCWIVVVVVVFLLLKKLTKFSLCRGFFFASLNTHAAVRSTVQEVLIVRKVRKCTMIIIKEGGKILQGHLYMSRIYEWSIYKQTIQLYIYTPTPNDTSGRGSNS